MSIAIFIWFVLTVSSKQTQRIKEYHARKKALLCDEWLREKIGEVKAVSQFWNDTQEERRLWNKINVRMNKMKQISDVAEEIAAV